MTELALEPVRRLATLAMLGSVSLRTPSNGRRYLVTIAKRFPDGEYSPPHYVWTVAEIAPDGEPEVGGQHCTSPAGAFLGTPEEAYWAAIDGLCTVQQNLS